MLRLGALLKVGEAENRMLVKMSSQLQVLVVSKFEQVVGREQGLGM